MQGHACRKGRHGEHRRSRERADRGDRCLDLGAGVLKDEKGEAQRRVRVRLFDARDRRRGRRRRVGHGDRDRIRGELETKRISRDSRQGVEPIARRGRVPGDRIRRSEVFRAKVDAVELELDARDRDTRGAQARTDGDRFGDLRVGGRVRNGHDQAAG